MRAFEYKIHLYSARKECLFFLLAFDARWSSARSTRRQKNLYAEIQLLLFLVLHEAKGGVPCRYLRNTPETIFVKLELHWFLSGLSYILTEKLHRKSSQKFRYVPVRKESTLVGMLHCPFFLIPKMQLFLIACVARCTGWSATPRQGIFIC